MNPSEKPTEVPRYDIKDSGERRTFSTGAQRDRAGGKSRPDLISPIALWRLGLWLEKGAQKYTERNWELGIPLSEYIASAHRHLLLLADGNEDEDHASALLFNAMAFIHTEHRIRNGDLPPELDDLSREKNLRNFLLTSAETPPKVEKPADVPRETWVDKDGVRRISANDPTLLKQVGEDLMRGLYEGGYHG